MSLQLFDDVSETGMYHKYTHEHEMMPLLVDHRWSYVDTQKDAQFHDVLDKHHVSHGQS